MAPNGSDKANIWPKMTKNAYFRPNLVVFGSKLLILMGRRKSSGTHISTEKPPGHLVRIDFWSGMGSNGPKMPVLGQIRAQVEHRYTDMTNEGFIN